MMFELFKKKCAVCSKKLAKGEIIKRFGASLCSSEHAEEYRKKIAKEQSKAASKGGCCG